MSKIRAYCFGAFAEPLATQLSDTNIKGGMIALLQQMADGLTVNWVQGVLTETEYSKALDRLTKRISLEIKKAKP